MFKMKGGGLRLFSTMLKNAILVGTGLPNSGVDVDVNLVSDFKNKENSHSSKRSWRLGYFSHLPLEKVS